MKGVTDFGDKGFDFSDFLDLRRFLQSCKDNDLFVIFRPGPYICGEWEFGGMPRYDAMHSITRPFNIFYKRIM